jgi:septum formation protein
MPIRLQKKLILASQSPRRIQLLSESGFEFSVQPADIDEIIDSNWKIEEVALNLAIIKANKILENYKTEDVIILAADTIVVYKNKILGKPTSEEEAQNMLMLLSGKTHVVYTGVAIRGVYDRAFTSTTKVTFGQLTNDEIIFYVKQFKPYDKAGAYGAQEWLGHCKIEELKGSYTNVMGLPMNEVYDALKPLIIEYQIDF